MIDRRKLVFRADGNGSVGAGHIMRCISIADAAGTRGIDSVFITAEDEFQAVIRDHRHENIVLNTDFRDMDGEAGALSGLLKNISPMAVVVDSYYVSPRYFEALRGIAGIPVVYLDDMASFPYDCDLLVNYNIYGDLWEERYRGELYAGKATPRLLLGSRYVPLRREFSEHKRERVAENGENILVSTGGADPDHFTLALLKAILKRGSGKRFHIVLGAMNEDKARIREMARGKNRIIIHENVTEMAALMLENDVAISAAGSTLYELCATRTSTITYVLEDNQVPGARAFERVGVLQNAGDIRECGAEALAQKLVTEAVALCDDVEKRRGIAEKQGRIGDGAGALRIVDGILELEKIAGEAKRGDSRE